VNSTASCRIVAGGPVSDGVETRLLTDVTRKVIGNLSMLQLNPMGYLAVLGSDGHRKAGRDARRCDG
jgi:hypothetical protein